jgi:hypothetical protein
MIFHAVPFHRSTSVVSLAEVLPALSPTAVHAVPDVQLMPHRPLTAVPFGLGLGTGDQRDPFHRSIRVAGGKPELSFTLPAAKQLDAVVQDTDLSVALRSPWGRGAGTRDQADPFHSSASGTEAPNASPTALQWVADTHQTDHSASSARGPPRLAAGTMDHDVPFHRSASACPLPAESVNTPTAMQNDGEGHDTEERKV